jgi:type II secretory pathway pseudopilin PulG
VDVLAPIVVIALLAVVVLVVSAPLRRGTAEAEASREEARLADLEAARDAKYREIRDAELDLRTGHLSERDWRLVDRQLRSEAMAILRQIDDLGAAPAERGRERQREPGRERERERPGGGEAR